MNQWSYQFQSLPFADKIDFNEFLSVILGGNYTKITNWNWDTTQGSNTLGQVTSRYDAQKVTPSGSVIYKPVPNIMTYFTYQEALTQGGIADTTYNGLDVTNPGGAPATVNRQYELGAKLTIDRMLLTLALFDITEATSLYQLNSAGSAYTYAANGKEEHKGVEIGVSGKVTDNITLYGGGTAMDTKIVSLPSDPLLVGKTQWASRILWPSFTENTASTKPRGWFFPPVSNTIASRSLATWMRVR